MSLRIFHTSIELSALQIWIKLIGYRGFDKVKALRRNDFKHLSSNLHLGRAWSKFTNECILLWDFSNALHPCRFPAGHTKNILTGKITQQDFVECKS